MPISIVTLGPTRGDDLATLRLEARAGELLPWLRDSLLRGRDAAFRAR
jgi:hypothetical protein